MVEGKKKTISLHPCTNEDMPQNRSDVFFILNLHNAFCLDEKEFKMQGHWDEVNVFYAIAELYPCENQTSNGICKSQAEIDEFLSKKKFFGIIFHDAYLDLKDYESPMKIKYHIESASIDPLYTKRTKIYIKTTKIFTDNGFLYPEDTMYENITFDRSEFDFQLESHLLLCFSMCFFQVETQMKLTEDIKKYKMFWLLYQVKQIF